MDAVPIKWVGGARLKFSKEPLRGTKILFRGRGWKCFILPLIFSCNIDSLLRRQVMEITKIKWCMNKCSRLTKRESYSVNQDGHFFLHCEVRHLNSLS